MCDNLVQRLRPGPETFGAMVGITFHHRDTLPTTQFLNRIEVYAGLHKPGGKGVTKIMEQELDNLRLSTGRVKRPQQIPGVDLPAVG